MNYAAALLAFNSDGSGRVLSMEFGGTQGDWRLISGEVHAHESSSDAVRRVALERAGATWVERLSQPVFTSLNYPRLTTTHLVTVFQVPVEFPSNVAWKDPVELCADACTHRIYNLRLFQYLGII